MPIDPVAINDDDTVSRLIFKPKDYLEGIGPLSLGKSLYFQRRDDYKESVNCQRLVTNMPQDLHQQGYEKAARDTVKRGQEGKDPVTYEGFSSVMVGVVRGINEGGHTFDVAHSPIDNNETRNDAHCDIVLIFPDTKPQTAQKNNAIQKLADSLSELSPPPAPTATST